MKRIFSLIVALMTLSLTTQAQTFYNLTADEVKIDSVIPHFVRSFPLPENYEDSVYTVSIAYPEYIDMPASQVEKFQSLASSPIPTSISIEQRIAFYRRNPMLLADITPFVIRNGKPQILASFMLKIQAKAKRGNRKKAQYKAQKADRYAAHSILAEGSWAKIRIGNTGFYQLTDEVIRKAGFSDLDKVKIYGYGGNLQNETLSAEQLAELDDLKEIPTCNIGGKRIFHALGPVSWENNTTHIRTRNPYSDYGYYFITESEEQPLILDEEQFLAKYYPLTDDFHSLYEVDGFSWLQGGRNLYDPETIKPGSSKTYTFRNERGAKSAKIYVKISSQRVFTATISINGHELGTIGRTNTLSEQDKGCEAASTFNVPQVTENNVVEIKPRTGVDLHLDYISVTWDTPAPAPNLSTMSIPVAEYVYNITNQDLHAHDATDYIIIIPTSQKLLEQAERLQKFHEEHDGYRVKIVPADELYNEFSSGTPDANAYRRYLKMLYDRAENESDMPKYLLLFGDGVWDNRMITSYCKGLNPDDYLLCFESENSLNKVSCYVDDCFYCLLDDGEGARPANADLQDMAVGRFPVSTPSDAKIMVDKTIDYMTNKYGGSWQNTLVFLGDDGNSNMHMRAANSVADKMNSLHPGYVIKKVMWDSYKRESTATGNTYPEVTELIKQYQKSGALIFDYCGHGREDQISHESVLKIADFASFNNQHMPLWITASCDIMPFDGTDNTIGETAILNSRGGAVAFYGTTRTVTAAQNEVINEAFIRHVLSKVDGKAITLGEAQRLAKNECITRGTDLSTNKIQYSLLGDPALSLQQPQLTAQIDFINDVSTTGSEALPTLKAGSIAHVKGHIIDGEDFNGIFSAIVRDTQEEIVCRQNNEEETPKAFVYNDRTKTLYNGSDSVRAGQFEFIFPVPKDINYADATGLINIFALDNSKTKSAHGADEHFLVGGSALQGTDSIGPSIYCYLNSPSFVNGDKVNPTPYFVAEISDQDGINATGSGIGHNLEMIIDGDILKTYVLNENFTFDFGTYKSGSTFYNIPELTTGPHKLLFRAWDVMNNSSVAELSFTVVNGLEPNILNVSCTRNPATTTTTFIIEHDRCGSEVDVDIDIFDLSGRLLWSRSESGQSSTATYTIDWDLTVDSGQRLQTGVYLYRARLSSNGSSKASKAKKLIVIGNN